MPTKVILALSILLGILLAYCWEFFCIYIIKKTALRMFGWKLHHSLYGLLFIIVGYNTQNSILIGLGIGIIFQHTVTDGFRFISKK